MNIVPIRCRNHNREQKMPLDILQVVLADDGNRTMRRLSAPNQDLVKGPWERCARPFDAGLYCQHCLNEGKRSPLPIDQEDWPDLDLADRPILFVNPHEFLTQATVELLQDTFPTIRQYTRMLDAVPPSYGSNQVLGQLVPQLQVAIQQRILGESGRLYRFQTEAIQAALDGSDVVVTTPTASGKTLAYLIPIFNTILQDPSATALYLSPLVALTEDQLETVTQLDGSGTDWIGKGARFSNYLVCRKLELGNLNVNVARYDGSVTDGDRQLIRRTQPQYLLTTPDMLHLALLNGAFDEKQWAYFFKGLRYVVIDELHTYRGVFGASFANLVRRLLRVCRAYGAKPKFLCASATIQKPSVVVEQLIGRKPVVIDGTNAGAPQNRRMFVLWSSQVDDDIRALSTQGKDVLLFALRNRIRTIAFGRSISEINDIYRFVTAELRESGSDAIRITPFMRELRPDEKRNIIGDLKRGTLHGVISTTALSMGIDIGNLSAAIIIGFPGSIADLWQQAGRAGRAGDGLVVLIAANNPLDQFFVNHPEVLFDLDAEPVYCNPNNPYIVRGHLLCAARELPLDLSGAADFGPSGPAVLEELLHEGSLLRQDDGRLAIPESMRKDFPSIPLRNLNFAIDVITEDRRAVIVQVDAARAQRALHRYAHYQHVNRYYEVTRYDVDHRSQKGIILVKELENPEYTTSAKIERDVRIRHTWSTQGLGNFSAHFGEVHPETNVVGYYKVPLFARNEPFRYQPLGIAAPRPLAYNTHGLWLTISPLLLHQCPEEEQVAGLYSLTEAVRLAIAIEELCDPSDLAAVSVIHHADTGQPTVMIYDSTPGGIGITEAASTKIEAILARALLILDECPYCSVHPESRGCPYCVTAQYGDETTTNRQVATEILKGMLG